MRTAPSSPACTRSACRSTHGQHDVPWPCNETKYIVHFPESPRDLVLRLRLRRQRPARQEVPRAAHRFGDGPRRGLDGRAHADPQADLARGHGQAPGRGVPVGLRQDQPGDARADASRAGRSRRSATTSPGSASARTAASTRSTPRPASSASRRAPSYKTNPNAMKTIERNTIFTNVAKTDDGDIWWEGMGDAARSPDRLEGPRLDARLGRAGRAPELALHRVASLSARPSMRTGTTRPACRSTLSCSAGAARPSCRWSIRRSTGSTACSSASTMSVETTAAAAGEVGQLRFDPFAMLPFCGYNMADYFKHWLEIGAKGDEAKLPKIFVVNWFRKDDDGNFIWPGFGENTGCSSGSSGAATARARQPRPRSGWCRRRATQHRGARHLRRGHGDPAQGRPGRGAPAAAPGRVAPGAVRLDACRTKSRRS